MAVWQSMRYVSSVGFQEYVSQLLSVIEAGTLSEEAFNELALQLCALQLQHNTAYRSLVPGRTKARLWDEIPAAPTAAFKELEMTSIPPGARIKEFRSSGTTGQKPSRHFHSLESLRVYEASLGRPLKEHFAKDGMRLVSLTPSPKEAPQSSLAHMFATAGAEFAGREDWSVDVGKVSLLTSAATKIGLMGTAFNFVNLMDAVGTLKLPVGSRALETGGYKGRSREVPRKELHEMIRSQLGVSEIVMEYGMCELSSQAYAHEDGIFHFPAWVRVQIVSPENGREVKEGETGLVRVFDLANVWSVMAVQTEDLGVRRGHGFELVGRASGAEARGCSLMSR